MRVKYFYCDENMLLLVNLYVRILDITTSFHFEYKMRRFALVITANFLSILTYI